MTRHPMFQLGKLVVTDSVWDALAGDHTKLISCLLRHMSGDWGDLCQDDKALNGDALTHGGRLFSAYTVGNHQIWIITEAEGFAKQREATTILLPEEY